MSTAVPVMKKDNLSTSASKAKRHLGYLEVAFGAKKMALPVSSVDVKAVVADRLAHVTIEQGFQNPYDDHLEAVFIFPLSGGCAVSSFVLKVDDRVVEGVVMERQAARETYTQALADGKQAAMMEQERENVFTVQVGNLPPGKDVQVVISYSEKLPYFDQGTTELRLPLVVAPRFNAGEELSRENVGHGIAPDTTAVPDASRISPPRLAPGARADLALDLTVRIEGEGDIADLSCSQHATKIGMSHDNATGTTGTLVSLARTDEVMDRDFVLRWSVAGDAIKSRLLILRPELDDNKADKTHCFGMLSLIPPKVDELQRPARDVIFVVDRSGSMGGLKMTSAARACSFLLGTLGPEDRFAIQAFDDICEWMKGENDTRFIAADEAGIEAGNTYLRDIRERGGTMLHEALNEAIAEMNKRPDDELRLPVIVLLTDGEVGNESHVYKNIQQTVGDSRVFTVGIDTAVNDVFLRRLASLGGGTSAFVEPGTQVEAALSQIGREIGEPLVTELKISDVNCGLIESSLAPNHLSDLFEGRALSIFFRLTAARIKDLAKAKIKVTGKFADGSLFSSEVSACATDVKALAQLWAKSYVTDLEDNYRLALGERQKNLKKEIIDICVDHAILSKFTAFVAVDSEIVNKEGNLRTVVQPVAQPALWEDEPVSAGFASAWGASANLAVPAAPAASGWGAAPPPPPYIPHPAGGLPGGPQAVRARYGSAPQNEGWAVPTGMPDNSGIGGASEDSCGSVFAAPPPPPLPPPGSPPASGAGGWAPPKLDQLGKVVKETIGDLVGDFEDALGLSRTRAKSPAPVPPPAPVAGPVPPPPPIFSETADEPLPAQAALTSYEDLRLAKSYKAFEAALRVVLAAIKEGKHLPSTDELKAARKKLLQDLNASSIASSAQALQKYLKADLLILLKALDSAKSSSSSSSSAPSGKLLVIAAQHQDLLDAIAEDTGKLIDENTRPFWDGGV